MVRDGLGKAGICRDADGVLHSVSLRCTHLGCLLHFNAAAVTPVIRLPRAVRPPTTAGTSEAGGADPRVNPDP